MRIKSSEKKLRTEILDLYLQGFNQEEILKKIRDRKAAKGLSRKKLRGLIRENYFLSPKNFRLGAVLLFLLTLLTPPATVYVRGYEYRPILGNIVLVSIIFASPFLIFSILMKLVKNLKFFYYLAVSMTVYLGIYILVFLLISDDIDLWTLVLFPLILLPTFIDELMKLRKLILTIEGNASKAKAAA